jgi:hypothetical protein
MRTPAEIALDVTGTSDNTAIHRAALHAAGEMRQEWLTETRNAEVKAARLAKKKTLKLVAELVDECRPHGQYERFDEQRLFRGLAALSRS